MKQCNLFGGILLASMPLVGGCSPAPEQPSPSADRPTGTQTMIEPGKPFPIEPGAVKSFPLEVPADAFLHVIVEQHGVDVVVSLTAVGQRLPVVSVDAPIGGDGDEELTAILLVAGTYRVDVTPPDDAGGLCTLHVAALRPATADDRRRVGADQIHREGWQLYREDPRSEMALDRYRHALTLRADLGLARQQAESLDAMAQLYGKRGQPDIALALLDRAIRLARAAGDRRHDRLRLASSLDRAGVIVRRNLRLPARAVGRYLAEATAIREAEQGGTMLALALHHLGRANYDLGELAQALDAYDRALPAIPASFMAILLRDRATTHLALHRGRDAYRDASRVVELTPGEGEKQRRRRTVAQTVQGRALIQVGDLDTAETVLEQVLADLTESDPDVYRADALQALGALHREAGRWAEARGRLEQARALLGEGGSVRSAIVDIELGYIDVLENQTGRGLERFERARAVFAERGDRRGEASVHAREAEALRDLGRLDEAGQRVERALTLVEDIRASTMREDVRLGFFAFRQEYYDIALDILARQYDAAPRVASALEALALHERRLARELGEHLERSDSTDEARVAEEAALMERIASAVSDPTAIPDSVDTLLADLAQMRARKPLAAPRTSGNRETGAIERLRQEAFGAGTVAVVLTLGETTGLRWVLDARHIRLERIDAARTKLEALAASWVEALRSGSREAETRRHRAGAELRRLLLPNDFPDGAERLVIVADGALQQLPFSALPLEADGPLLIERFEIVMQPSLSSLLALRERSETHPSWPRPVAVMADPVFEATDPRLGRVAKTDPSDTTPRAADRDLERTAQAWGLDSFPRLEHSADEASIIVSLMGKEHVTAAVGFEASRATLDRLDLGHLGLLHFATHALVDAERPDLSSLVLSRFAADGTPRPGALYAFEIAGWSLSADLVVLSACDTGRGRDVRGEGVLGLARRFLDAGATRMVASLWRVGDRATAELMIDFYQRLLEHGHPPATALRQAQLALIEQSAATSAWAGFAFQGDWQPFRKTEPHPKKDDRP